MLRLYGKHSVVSVFASHHLEFLEANVMKRMQFFFSGKFFRKHSVEMLHVRNSFILAKVNAVLLAPHHRLRGVTNIPVFSSIIYFFKYMPYKKKRFILVRKCWTFGNSNQASIDLATHMTTSVI